jgi:hypothetical protein
MLRQIWIRSLAVWRLFVLRSVLVPSCEETVQLKIYFSVSKFFFCVWCRLRSAFLIRSRARARGFSVPRPEHQARQQDSSRSRFSRRQVLGSHLIFLSTASFFVDFLVSHGRQDFSLPAFAVWHSCAVRFCRKKIIFVPALRRASRSCPVRSRLP